MLKGFFLSLPSDSVNNTLLPIIDKISTEGYEILYYNSKRPEEKYNFEFRDYPLLTYEIEIAKINSETSYYQLADILVNTASTLMDFLIQEVEKEKPDFILHPHLSIWAKMIASSFKIPAIMLSSTFIMDERIMHHYYKKYKVSNKLNFSTVHYAFNFWKQSKSIHNKLKILNKPDIWDAYINREGLNLAFILKEFQPEINLFDQKYHFLGFPQNSVGSKINSNLIYVSFGTIFNNNHEVYKICISVLSTLKNQCAISIGKHLNVKTLGELPTNIFLKRHVNQEKVLNESKLFITSGGMASVNEAIQSRTPMIVIPQIIEQVITAERIEDLGIGIHIKALTKETLQNAICDMMQNYSMYSNNILNLSHNSTAESVKCEAFNLIDDFLKSK